MDTLIKMCNHPLIQAGWEPKVGDWTDKGLIVSVGGGWCETICSSSPYSPDRVVQGWSTLIHLPGIRQLMGMVKHSDYWYVQHDMFDRWVASTKPAYRKRFSTEQEARLAFVMHEKHQLRWLGERWSDET